MSELPQLKGARKQIVRTPYWVYDVIREYFNATWFDPCPVNPTFDGLEIPWEAFNYVNPPYNNISPFIEKAITETKRGNVSLFLVPLRMDSAWMVQHIWGHYEIIPIRGRITFEGYKRSMPFGIGLVLIEPVGHPDRHRVLYRPCKNRLARLV
jgi:hypothetical protein